MLHAGTRALSQKSVNRGRFTRLLCVVAAAIALSTPSLPSGVVASTTPTPAPSEPRVSINAIFSQLNPGNPFYERFANVLASPLVDGISTALNWAMVDHGPADLGGQYQWRTFDNGIERFI